MEEQRMIKLNQLSKNFYLGQSNPIPALKAVDLQIAKGEFVILVGANGSGKSTLLNLIAGTVQPTTGEIYFKDYNVTAWPNYKRSKWIARVFQNPMEGSAAELSIIENFRLAALRTQSKWLKIGIDQRFRQRVYAEVAALGMGLEEKLDQSMQNLSGGQRQALSLLMSVMCDTEILLLDEPTAALDPKSAEVVMQLAAKLIQDYGLTAIMVTHNLNDAFKYGTRIIQLQEGKLLRDLGEIEKQHLDKTALLEWFY